MFKNVLFDLDGTLLGLDLDIFVPTYLQLLHEELSPYLGQDLKERVLKATQAMVHSDGYKTNQEIFFKVFFHNREGEREEAMERFTQFYREAFPTLEKIAERRPFARKILSALLKERRRVVIATNPLFPKEAVFERLRWAGIHDLPYSLITSFENMHYCKPKLAYYSEILDKINGKARETLMVGNDVEEDMVAKELGITTFLVKGYIIHRENHTITPDYKGSLEDLYMFLQDTCRVEEGRG